MFILDSRVVVYNKKQVIIVLILVYYHIMGLERYVVEIHNLNKLKGLLTSCPNNTPFFSEIVQTLQIAKSYVFPNTVCVFRKYLLEPFLAN